MQNDNIDIDAYIEVHPLSDDSEDLLTEGIIRGDGLILEDSPSYMLPVPTITLEKVDSFSPLMELDEESSLRLRGDAGAATEDPSIEIMSDEETKRLLESQKL